MKSLYWAVSGTCHLRCRYCFYEVGMNPRPTGFVDEAAAASLIPRLAEVFKSVAFTGGEPLLNPDFWTLVRIARRFGLSVSFFTDGIRLNRATQAKIVDLGVSRVYVSLDSVDPVLNGLLRQSRSGRSFAGDGVLKNIEQLAADRPPSLSITVLQTVCRPTIRCIDAMVGFCDRLGVDLLVHAAGIPPGREDLACLSLENCSADELRRLEGGMLRWADGHAGRTKYTGIVLDMLAGAPLPVLHCPMGSEAYFLDVDGSMHPCFHRTDLRSGSAHSTHPRELSGRGRFPSLANAPCASLACACMLE